MGPLIQHQQIINVTIRCGDKACNELIFWLAYLGRKLVLIYSKMHVYSFTPIYYRITFNHNQCFFTLNSVKQLVIIKVQSTPQSAIINIKLKGSQSNLHNLIGEPVLRPIGLIQLFHSLSKFQLDSKEIGRQPTLYSTFQHLC